MGHLLYAWYCALSGYFFSTSESEVAQPCPTLCDPVDHSLPGSCVCGIFQARALGWAAIAFSFSTRELVKHEVQMNELINQYRVD